MKATLVMLLLLTACQAETAEQTLARQEHERQVDEWRAKNCKVVLGFVYMPGVNLGGIQMGGGLQAVPYNQCTGTPPGKVGSL